MGKIYIICPDCGKAMSFDEIENWENKTIECIRCHVRRKGGEYTRGIKASAPNYPGGGSPANKHLATQQLTPPQISGSAGQLRVLGTGQIYKLQPGRHVVGRKSETMEVDFPIENDDRHMSRRNVEIDVVHKGGGFAHHLVEINSKNVVKINGMPVGKGDVAVLHYGDVVTLGNTEIILENADKEDTLIFLN